MSPRGPLLIWRRVLALVGHPLGEAVTLGSVAEAGRPDSLSNETIDIISHGSGHWSARRCETGGTTSDIWKIYPWRHQVKLLIAGVSLHIVMYGEF